MTAHGSLLGERRSIPPSRLQVPVFARNAGREHTPVVLLASCAVPALGLANGGFHPRTWAWASVALVWIIASTILLRGSVYVSRLECAAVVCLLAVAGWTALSASWSRDASLSLQEGERALLYALALAALVLLTRRGSGAFVVCGVLGGIGVLIVLALAIQLLPLGLGEADPYEGYLLFRPVGYANAVGILAAMGVLLAGGAATRASSSDLRRIGAGALVPLAAALTLSGSRGAALALVAGAAAAIALDHDRRGTVAELLALLPGPLLAVAASTTVDLRGDYPAIAAGPAAALALVIATLGVLTAVISPLARAIARRPVRPRAKRVAVAGIVLAVLVLVSGAAGRVGSTPVLGDRTAYWAVAWQQFGDHPLVGSGAGSFAVRWLESGSDHGARDAHSLYLESLAELGSIGLALVLIALALPVVAGLRVRQLGWVPATFGAYVAFLVHAGLDWDWEMPVVTLAALYLGCSLLVAARRPLVGSESTPGAHVAAYARRNASTASTRR